MQETKNASLEQAFEEQKQASKQASEEQKEKFNQLEVMMKLLLEKGQEKPTNQDPHPLSGDENEAHQRTSKVRDFSDEIHSNKCHLCQALQHQFPILTHQGLIAQLEKFPPLNIHRDMAPHLLRGI